ncbi:hypothetical protein K1T71_000250 [Dendrolimus kikuchii]|uniref:Uncharacterized protein n=1 Tax=Dendrolimus kikuchii TaxID=765133 RepID=A0ACC1DIU5_9NEOP|nr:hypothetical protein K1T71_000250 [Dendrolimus kikuchii]
MSLEEKTTPAVCQSHLMGATSTGNMLLQQDDDDEFEDASDELSTSLMDLDIAFDDCERAIRKFFNNELVEAMEIMKPWARSSLYHSLGTAIFEFIPAMLTFDHTQISRALTAIKACICICNQHRKYTTFVESIGSLIRKPNYSTYTDIEAHAELCYAEALLLQAAMTIMEGEDLTGLIKGTIKVKNCYNSYKERLYDQLWSNPLQNYFQDCHPVGYSISILIISLLDIFLQNAFGLAELEASSKSPGLRSVLCDLTLLAYHLVICQFIGAEEDVEVCDRILKEQLKVYRDGVWFLIFKGRLELMRGSFNQAIVTYNTAIASQDIWKQFHHVCYWEIMWANGLIMDWREAAFYAQKLINESTWSRTIYSYAKAAMLLQLNIHMSKEEKLECNQLLVKAGHYKQRIAGKSLPMEKFVIKRSARYQAQGGWLLLPGIELICLWNMFHILSANHMATSDVLKVIKTTEECIDSGPKNWMGRYEADNRALVRYLHGCCLAHMGLPNLAIAALDSVFEFKNDLKEDTFLLPYSLVEIAMCHHQLGQSDQALLLLQDARKRFSGYSLESRLQFRIHSKMDIIKGSIKVEASNQVTSL